MPVINDPLKNPLGNQVVDMSLSKTLVSGSTTVITVTLRSIGALPSVASTYITDNNLEKELLIKAGLADQTISTLTDISTQTIGEFFLYTVDVTLSTS